MSRRAYSGHASSVALSIIKEQLVEAFQRLPESPSRQQWDIEVGQCNVDLTPEESTAFFDELSSGRPTLPEVPGWALAVVEEAEESSVAPTWMFYSANWVAFLSLDSVTPCEDDDDETDRTDECLQRTYTFISKDVCSAIKLGDSSVVNLLADGDAAVALIFEHCDGSRIVIEAGAAVHDYYTIESEPGESGASEPGASPLDGRITAYCCTSEDYAAVEVETAQGKFWLPVTLASPRAYSTGGEQGAEESGSTSQFGQHGSDFYVNRGGEKMHITTALKILQRWVDEVSHNRGERFRAKRTTSAEGDLTPLSFYAIKRPTATMNGFVYTVASLDKLVRVAESSNVAHLDVASYDSANLEAQFTMYDLGDDGVYRRSAHHTKQEKLTPSSSRVIKRVDLQLSDEVSGGRLAESSKAALLSLSFIDTQQATRLHHVKLKVTKKKRSAASPKPPSLTGHLRLAQADSRLRGVVLGDLLVSIDGERQQEGATAARSALRAAMTREATLGGRVDLVFWRPPDGWTPPEPEEEAEGGSDVDVAEGGSTALPEFGEWPENEMISLARITKRLEGGDSGSNLKRLCAAVGIQNDGSDLNKKRRLEAELRRRGFPSNADWEPTHADITALFGGQAGVFYAKFDRIVHSVPAVARFLRALPQPAAH